MIRNSEVCYKEKTPKETETHGEEQLAHEQWHLSHTEHSFQKYNLLCTCNELEAP